MEKNTHTEKYHRKNIMLRPAKGGRGWSGGCSNSLLSATNVDKQKFHPIFKDEQEWQKRH